MAVFLKIIDEKNIIWGFYPDKWQIDKNKTKQSGFASSTMFRFNGFGYDKCCLKLDNYVRSNYINTLKYKQLEIDKYNIICNQCRHEIIGTYFESNIGLSEFEWKYYLINCKWEYFKK